MPGKCVLLPALLSPRAPWGTFPELPLPYLPATSCCPCIPSFQREEGEVPSELCQPSRAPQEKI